MVGATGRIVKGQPVVARGNLGKCPRRRTYDREKTASDELKGKDQTNKAKLVILLRQKLWLQAKSRCLLGQVDRSRGPGRV
jgi:hypothetical protein